jgi:hypothetical protein
VSGRDDADDDGDSLRKDATRPGWPVELRGVTESLVTTLGPNGRWNVAALGLHAPDGDGPVTARTWGNTRTRRNFHREGGGVVQFTADPLDFVTAALSVREEPEPVLPSADAWVRVDAVAIDTGESGGTDWEDWALHPTEAEVRGRRVPTVNRGFNAVVEATVAASRLDVPAYDTATLRDRLAYLSDVVDRCGGPAEREAFDRLGDLTGWRSDDG